MLARYIGPARVNEVSLQGGSANKKTTNRTETDVEFAIWKRKVQGQKQKLCRLGLLDQTNVICEVLGLLGLGYDQRLSRGTLFSSGLFKFKRYLGTQEFKVCSQKYSRLRCLLHVKGLTICFYLGWSGSILQIRTNIIKAGLKSWLFTCSSNCSYTVSAL